MTSGLRELLVTDKLRDVAFTDYELLIAQLDEQLNWALNPVERGNVEASLAALRNQPLLVHRFKECLVFIEGLRDTVQTLPEETFRTWRQLFRPIGRG